MSFKLRVARLEITEYIQTLIEKFDLDEEELLALAGTIFRDAIMTSLSIYPHETLEKEEEFVNKLFQELLNNTTFLLRRLEQDTEPNNL